MLRNDIAEILSLYSAATKEDFTGHPLANKLRAGLPAIIQREVRGADRYLVKGSAGKGNWVRCPWVSLLNPTITTSVQKGYYVVLLFREDMSGYYLSLNQGVQSIIEGKYEIKPKEILLLQAKDFRAQLGTNEEFPLESIDLAPSSKSNLSAYYECGHVVGKYYDARALPADSQLVYDIERMLALYDYVAEKSERLSLLIQAPEEDEPQDLSEIERIRFRKHKIRERNQGLVRKVKRLKGCVCEVCGFHFEHSYGAIGKDYIEAHHLQPLSELDSQEVRLDPVKDFAVLCANCHRMIHRLEKTDDLGSLRQRL